MSERRSVQGFGVGVAIGVDALFWGALLYLYVFARRGMTEDWPDIVASAVASPVLPLVAVALVGNAAAFARKKLALTFLSLLASLLVLGLFWHGATGNGLTPKAGRYGNVVYLTTALLAAHIAGAWILAGTHIVRHTPAPHLGRFLAFLTGAGCLVVLLVFVW